MTATPFKSSVLAARPNAVCVRVSIPLNMPDGTYSGRNTNCYRIYIGDLEIGCGWMPINAWKDAQANLS